MNTNEVALKEIPEVFLFILLLLTMSLRVTFGLEAENTKYS